MKNCIVAIGRQHTALLRQRCPTFFGREQMFVVRNPREQFLFHIRLMCFPPYAKLCANRPISIVVFRDLRWGHIDYHEGQMPHPRLGGSEKKFYIFRRTEPNRKPKPPAVNRTEPNRRTDRFEPTK